jgi:multidrug resistance efflux pump
MPRIKFLLIAPLLFIVFLSASCKKEKKLYNGYIEADYVYISSYTNGKINAVYVSKGEHIKNGTKLFKVDGKKEEANFNTYSQAAKGVDSYIEDMGKGARSLQVEMWNDMAKGIDSLSEGSGIGTNIVSKFGKSSC